MSPFRKDIVKKVYKKLDFNDNGTVESDDVKHFYNAKNHPEVRKGRKTEQEVLQEFMETFEAHHQMNTEDVKGDGRITLNEFMDYYSNVSASIDNDEYF